MLSRSSDAANQDTTGQSATALPFAFLPRRKPRGLGRSAFHSEFILRDAERPQTALREVAPHAYSRRMHAIVSHKLQHEAIPTLGRLAKRVLDLVISSGALLLIWPLMLVIAIAIKLESSDPVIYPSLRLGEKGRRFACYKFRTMVPGADELKGSLRRLNQRRGPFFKIADDPRVTRFGRFLRKYSLDELPQFWNVLKGDMSLVGPRPHPVEDCAEYTSEHCRRLAVTPGITGLWQVLARAHPSFEVCMRLDLAYIEKWSLLLDCSILMKTIPAVLAGEGK